MDADGEHAAADPWIGCVLAGRYRIDARLGEGGMGTVYRAQHLALDRAVAVKLLHSELTRDEGVAKRFDREALASSKLDHPNCVRVMDAGSADDGTKFLVMELLQGRELHARGDGRVPVARAIELVSQILHGLEHAHARGLVHRDLKPENIFVVRDHDGRERVKLVDFGIVKLLRGEDVGGEALTRVGLVFGTPMYMSPEQVAGGKIDERTDLYSVGVILHELLAGTPPFDADEPGILLRMHLIADPPALPDDVPAALRDAVAKLLAKSPGDRPASAREARELLARALTRPPAPPPMIESAPPPTTPPLPPSGTWKTVVAIPAPVPAARPSRSRSTTIALVIACVIVALVIGGASLQLRGCGSSSTANPPTPAAPAVAPSPAPPAEADTAPIVEDEDEDEKDRKDEKRGKHGGRKHKKKKHHD